MFNVRKKRKNSEKREQKRADEYVFLSVEVNSAFHVKNVYFPDVAFRSFPTKLRNTRDCVKGSREKAEP